ncbi:hypothetical protein A4A49_05359 [Nicotiana attenuata]|uniref:Uncharacterized protein n=1 Tax=Nicotiana attenuata TaxID=49451 RepID=A0A1J6IK68_NICAT|nr:hypothetical protein A4A49_05359 [Nicotiana attenuata]
MEDIEAQQTENGNESVEAFAAVMGPEHPGRLRLYGWGVTRASLRGKEPTSWLLGSDVVVVDPPRKGLDPSLVKELRHISALELRTNSSKRPEKVRDKKRLWVLRAREALVQIENTTVHEEDQSLPQTLIYISCGWESFKEDCLSLLASKE